MDTAIELLIHELVHLLVGLLLGLILFKATGKKQTIFWTMAATLLIDSDHLIDYLFAYGFNLDINNVTGGAYFKLNRQLFLPLHSWELAIVLILIGLFTKSKSKFKYPLLSIGLGFFGHLWVDQLTNMQTNQGIYFLILRMLHGFSSPRFW